MNVLVAFWVSFIVFYALYGFECWINGSMPRNPFHALAVPLIQFCEEILWNLPGGRERYVRTRLFTSRHHDDFVIGRHATWNCAEVMDTNQYAAAGRDILPGPLHLIVYLAILLWPIALFFV